MSRAVTARLVRRPDRASVLAYLAGDPLANLFLLDLASRLGDPPAPGELRTEMAAALNGSQIAGVACLRPSVVLDGSIGAAALEAMLPYFETLGVGLVKSASAAVDTLWEQLAARAPRRTLIDRMEMAYSLGAASAARLPVPAARVREATPGDLEPLVVAARSSLLEEGRPDPFASDVRGFRRWVRGRIARARVIEADGRVVFVGYADVRRAEGWLIQGVYTWPEWRKRGLARSGVAGLCREAFASGADHVQLAVVDGNAAGQRLYEGLGFQPFSRLRTILFSEG